MNKTELVAKVADITGVGRNDVRAVIDCCFDTITNILEMDGKVFSGRLRHILCIREDASCWI